MRKLFALIPLLLSLAACTSGTPKPATVEPLRIISATVTPELAEANEDMRLEITYSGGSGPYEFKVGLAGPTAPVKLAMTREAGTTTAALHFTAPELAGCTEQPFTATILATDANEAFAGPTVVPYAVLGTGLPPLPLATYNAATGIVTITVSDPDGNDVTVTPTTPPAFVPLAPQTIVGGDGTVDFQLTAADIFGGADGDFTFTADDGTGGVQTTTVHATIQPLTLAADTLYAIPMQRTVRAGETVNILVATGTLPNPFQYMTGIRVCFPSEAGAEYEDRNINPGSLGGEMHDFDGIWADVEPNDWFGLGSSFYSFYPPIIWLEDGREAIDFSLTPLGGHDALNASGALFSFYLIFNNPGTWPLTFQEFNIVSRTYYNDGHQNPDYFWSDISNDHPGIPNSITVIP